MENSTKKILLLAGVGAASYFLLKKKAPESEKKSAEISLEAFAPNSAVGPGTTENVTTCLGTSSMGHTMGGISSLLVSSVVTGYSLVGNRDAAITQARRDAEKKAKELERIPQAVDSACRRDPIRVIPPPTNYIRSIVSGPVLQYVSPIFVEKGNGKFDTHVSNTQVILPGDVVGTNGITVARKVDAAGRPVEDGDLGVVMYRVARTGYYVDAKNFMPVKDSSSQGKALTGLTEAPFDLRVAGDLDPSGQPQNVYAAPTYNSDKIGQYVGLIVAPQGYPNAVMGEYTRDRVAPTISCSWYPVMIADKTGLTKGRVGFIAHRDTRVFHYQDMDNPTYRMLEQRFGWQTLRKHWPEEMAN